MKTARYVIAAAMIAGTSAGAHAQGLTITPSFGAYIPASDLRDLRDEAEDRRLDRSGTFGLGLAVEAGWLRGSLAYASGATISEDEGLEGDVGDGSVLAVAADIVLRPLPRIIVQPYLLGGIGLKRLDYSWDDDGLGGNPLPEDKRDVALHAGIGADLMLGRFGIMAEITDYITRKDEGGFGQHDAFAFVGLKVRL